MPRSKGSKNKPKVTTTEQREALAPKRRGRPPGSKNRSTSNTVIWNGEIKSLDEILRPPQSTLSDEPATDDFCPINSTRKHHGYAGQYMKWCSYCGHASPTLVFEARKDWN